MPSSHRLIRHIVTVLKGCDRDRHLVVMGMALAQRFTAHLDGLHTSPSADDLMAATAAAGGMPAAMGGAIEAEEERLRERAENARQVFDSETEVLSRVETLADSQEASARFVKRQGRFNSVGVHHVRCSDLAVAALPTGDDSFSLWQDAETLLFDTGRPVLFVPPEADAPAANAKIIVAWKNSAEAARACHDAIPFMIRGASVEVLSVGEGEAPELLAETLARHGISASSEEIEKPNDRNTGEVLLDTATQRGASLLVMGGYGQSRLREFVFGGATRTVLQESSVPVLMTH